MQAFSQLLLYDWWLSEVSHQFKRGQPIWNRYKSRLLATQPQQVILNNGIAENECQFFNINYFQYQQPLNNWLSLFWNIFISSYCSLIDANVFCMGNLQFSNWKLDSIFIHEIMACEPKIYWLFARKIVCVSDNH